MPYTAKQAKQMAKGIVKVQISTSKDEEGNRYSLIYDQERKLEHFQKLTQGVEEAMGERFKGYFYYRINKVGFAKLKKEIELLHDAPTQDW